MRGRSVQYDNATRPFQVTQGNVSLINPGVSNLKLSGGLYNILSSQGKLRPFSVFNRFLGSREEAINLKECIYAHRPPQTHFKDFNT